jgi:hypothetical protein
MKHFMKYFQNKRNGNITAVTNVSLEGVGFKHLLNEVLFDEIGADEIPARFRVGGSDERLNGEMIAAWEKRG